jgi:exopolyphosphatase / guanosine-5'-triphosphate,3'-diphosphate pyrophosphatase
MTFAAVDIGTNTMLTVIGTYTEQDSWKILHDVHAIARLGEGVDRTGRISGEALERATAIARDIRSLCDREDVRFMRAVATSAVRDAQNGKEVREVLGAVLGCSVECISGDEEARLSFLGTIEGAERQTVIDIGGGSTEYCTGENYTIEQRKSLQIGAVRLHERYLHSLPPKAEDIQSARAEIQQQLATLPQANRFSCPSLGMAVGVGGTFTTLAALDMNVHEFDSSLVHRYILSSEKISKLTTYLTTHSIHDITTNPAVHPGRADILPAGALILDETMKFFQLINYQVSIKGLRYGILYDSVNQ